MNERIEFLMSASGINGIYEREGALKEAENIAYRRGKGDISPVNLTYEIVSAAVTDMAPGLLQQALENEVHDARNELDGLAGKIAEKIVMHEHDGVDAWHNGAWQVIARRIAEACAALGLEIDEDDVDTSTGVLDAIKDAAEQLENN